MPGGAWAMVLFLYDIPVSVMLLRGISRASDNTTKGTKTLLRPTFGIRKLAHGDGFSTRFFPCGLEDKNTLIIHIFQ